MSFNQKTNCNLTTLKLDSCWELTNQTVLHIGINNFLNHKYNFRHFHFRIDCSRFNVHIIFCIVSGLPTLRHLSLSGCSKITDEGIEILAENLTHLRTLDLSWGPRITDASLECIACDLVCLEELILDRFVNT